MQTTIIYITGIYDTLDLFTQELKNAFETMGYASFTYDARLEEESKQALIECIEEGTKKDQRFFCVTFNNLGYNLSLPAGMTGTGMLLKQDIFQSTAGSKRAGSAIQSGYGGACAGTERTGERCVYTKGWDQKCLGILRHPVSQHSDGSSVSL